MVHLMLKAGGEHAFDLFLVDFAVAVEPAGADRVRPVDLGILVGDRQAALIVGARLGGAQDLGVDEDQRVADRLAAFLLRILKVDDQDPLRNAHLDRGEADAGGGVHRLEHVVDERLDLGVISSTGVEIRRSKGSGASMMGRMAMAII